MCGDNLRMMILDDDDDDDGAQMKNICRKGKSVVVKCCHIIRSQQLDINNCFFEIGMDLSTRSTSQNEW